MSDIFDKSELALAAYADLQYGVATKDQMLKLQDAGMAEKQAAEFVKRWPEVDALSN